MTSMGEVDVGSLSDEERSELLEALAEKDPKAARKVLSRIQRDTREERLKEAAPEPIQRKRAAKQGVSLKPSDKPDEALAQVRRSFEGCWGDDSENPAVALLALESHLCARINSYIEGKWQHRRVGDDAVIAILKLRDGTSETRRFTRGVIDAEWKRS